MPELPEVEVIRRDLAPVVVGRTIESVKLTAPRLTRRGGTPEAVEAALAGRTVRVLRRRGKFLLFDLDGEASLVVRLGMTGQLRWSANGEGFRPDTHTHAQIVLGPPALGDGEVCAAACAESPRPRGGVRVRGRDGSRGQTPSPPPSPSSREREKEWGSGVLYYRDVRKFGEVFLLPTAEVDRRLRIGREPLDPAFGPEDLFRLCRSEARIKALLLDQTKLAGVGNIYADEALFRAGIRPTRRARRVTRAQARHLLRALRAVLQAGIRHRGSSISDYRDASGNPGRFVRFHRVYHRHGQPCPRCGNPIRRIWLGQRGTHFCPTCQR